MRIFSWSACVRVRTGPKDPSKGGNSSRDAGYILGHPDRVLIWELARTQAVRLSLASTGGLANRIRTPPRPDPSAWLFTLSPTVDCGGPNPACPDGGEFLRVT